jgi:flagellar basal body-associated protein FliL
MEPNNNNTIPVSRGDLVEPESIANGPILVLLVILLLAVLGGMYRWFVVLNKDVPTIMTTSRPTEAQNKEPESPTAQAQTEAYKVVSNSDEVPAIEADVEGTNLDSLDGELNAIDAEIDAAVGGKAASSSAQ